MTKGLIEDIRQSLIPFVKKELLKINKDGLGESDAEEFEKDLNEVLDLASKALEQQPSIDCVSREQAIVQLSIDLSEIELPRIKDSLDKLPLVTPTRKTGKWIEERDDYGNITGWHCSNCYNKTGFVTTCAWDYCPSCGAEMKGESNNGTQ